MANPSILTLFTSIVSDLEGELGVDISLKMKVFLRALAAVQAAKLKLYYLQTALVQKNIFVDTADPEAIGGTLERFGRVKLGRDPFKATAGEYTLTVTGTIGGVIPAGSTFKSDDDSFSPGFLYVVDVDKTLVAPTDTVPVRALTTGVISLLEVADGLTATAPILLVDSEAVVFSVDTIPLAAETTEAYRAKAIEAYQLESQGGASSDYRIWSFDAQGVKTVYPFAVGGDLGKINLFIEATLVDSDDGKGTPGAAIIADVETVVEFDPDTTKPLNERGRRPISAFEIFYLAITIKDIEITVTGSGGLSADTKTKFETSVALELSKIRPFVSGADDPLSLNDTLTTNFLISLLQDAKEPTETFTTITMKVATVSVSTFQFLNGDIPFLQDATPFIYT